MGARDLQVINPYTEETAFSVPMMDAGDVDALVGRARKAFEAWRWVPMAERVALCRGFVEAFGAMRDRVATDITAQMGKPLQQAKNEVGGLLDRAHHMIAIAEETLADEWLPEKEGLLRPPRPPPDTPIRTPLLPRPCSPSTLFRYAGLACLSPLCCSMASMMMSPSWPVCLRWAAQLCRAQGTGRSVTSRNSRMSSAWFRSGRQRSP